MIRQPTGVDAQYAFWRRASAGERVPTIEDEPHPGLYRMRMVKGGPWVPVEIWLEQEIDAETGELVTDEVLRATCDGAPRDPVSIWTRCRAVSEGEYEALIAAKAGIEEMEATHVAVDLHQMAAIRP